MSRAVGLLVSRSWMNLCAIACFLGVARYLTPAEVGIYALASSVVALFMLVIGAGFYEHVLSRDTGRQDVGTAFWCSTLTGAAGAGLTLLAALLVEVWTRAPDAAEVLAVLAPVPLLWGLSVILEAVLLRDNRAGSMTAVLLVAEAAGLAATFAALHAGWGLAAMSWGRLLNSVVTMAGYAVAARPGRLGFSPTAARRLTGFSTGVMGARLSQWAGQYASDLLLGLQLSTSAVGHFRMAARLQAAVGVVSVYAPASAQLAYMGAAARRGVRPGRGLVTALQLHLTLATPIVVAVAVLSDDLVALALGPRWQETGPLLSMFSLASFGSVVASLAASELIVAGLSRRLMLLQLAACVVGLAGLSAGAAFGLFSAAALKAATVVLLAGASVLALPSRSLRPRTLRSLGLVILRALLAGGLMAAAMLAAGAVLAAHGLPGHDLSGGLAPAGEATLALEIGLRGVVGLCAYGLVLPLVAPAAWRQLLLKLPGGLLLIAARRGAALGGAS